MADTKYSLNDDFNQEFEDSKSEDFDDLSPYQKPDAGSKMGAEEDVSLARSKVVLIRKLLENIRENSEKIEKLISGSWVSDAEARITAAQIGEQLTADDAEAKKSGEEAGRIIEGVFDGENMIGPDGKQYSVPANYASKSKLIEGDILKLTITRTGTFVYKQIGPIERTRVVGRLEMTDNGNFTVVSGSRRWKVLTASVTYYKGQEGDEVVILVPKAGDSKWAAVENIVRNIE